MAKVTIKTADEYSIKLSQLEAQYQDGVAGKAIYAGAKVVADQVKSNLKALPVDKNRPLKSGEKFDVLTQKQKDGLLAHFGISPMKQDADGNYNVKCGFDGYVEGTESKKYPQGLPAPLLARAIESGSSVRQKHPFARPAVSAIKGRAKEEMARVIDDECQKIMKG